MREELQDLWNSVESRKWNVMETVARLPQESLSRKIPGSDWTPLQLVDHLILAEEQQLKEIEAASKTEPRAHRAFMFRSLVWVLRKGIRVPSPETMAPNPNPGTLQELGAKWDAVRARMHEALLSAHDTRPFAAHEQLGAMTADQVLTVTDAHLQYHQKQIGS
jgi:hypothetical protein